MDRITIIGVGLIGGSFGLALKKYGWTGTITGVDDSAVLERAKLSEAIDEGCKEVEPAIAAADLVLLATPILATLDLLERVRRAVPSTAIVTDVGSTKSRICDRGAELFGDGPWFVGGHPLAGRERHGVDAADAQLFAGSRWVLTPHRVTHLETAAGRGLLAMIERVGAQPLVMDAEAHDEIVSWTSHLPQMVSTALAAVIGENITGAEDLRLSASGLRDTTRLADSSYRVWRDICLTNSDNLDVALAALVQKLEHLRDNLKTRGLEEEFQRAHRLREQLRGLE